MKHMSIFYAEQLFIVLNDQRERLRDLVNEEESIKRRIGDIRTERQVIMRSMAEAEQELERFGYL